MRAWEQGYPRRMPFNFMQVCSVVYGEIAITCSCVVQASIDVCITEIQRYRVWIADSCCEEKGYQNGFLWQRFLYFNLSHQDEVGVC